jgi:hypothetical protein
MDVTLQTEIVQTDKITVISIGTSNTKCTGFLISGMEDGNLHALTWHFLLKVLLDGIEKPFHLLLFYKSMVDGLANLNGKRFKALGAGRGDIYVINNENHKSSSYIFINCFLEVVLHDALAAAEIGNAVFYLSRTLGDGHQLTVLDPTHDIGLTEHLISLVLGYHLAGIGHGLLEHGSQLKGKVMKKDLVRYHLISELQHHRL